MSRTEMEKQFSRLQEQLESTRMATALEMGAYTLGSLIETLDDMIIKAKERMVKKNQDTILYIALPFDGILHGTFTSYRGYYSDLAMLYTSGAVSPLHCEAAKFLANLKECVGYTFEGWKGGDYKMSKDTLMWVSNEGESSDMGVGNVVFDGQKTIYLIPMPIDDGRYDDELGI